MRYYHTSFRMVLKIECPYQVLRQSRGLMDIADGNAKGDSHFEQQFQSVVELNVHLPYDLEIPVLHVYLSRKKHLLLHTKTLCECL